MHMLIETACLAMMLQSQALYMFVAMCENAGA